MSEGTHIILDCYDVPHNVCLDDRRLLKVAVKAASAGGANVINSMRYLFGHESPPGCSVIIMLDESHISIHTYAEKEEMAIDIFTCGDTNADEVAHYLKTSLSLRNCKERRFQRFQGCKTKGKSHLYRGVHCARNSPKN